MAVGATTSVAVPSAIACLACGRLDCDEQDPIMCASYAHPLARRADISVVAEWHPVYERDRRRLAARSPMWRRIFERESPAGHPSKGEEVVRGGDIGPRPTPKEGRDGEG